HAREEPRARVDGQDRHGVGGHAEVRGMAERRQPGVPEQEVEAHREDRRDQRLCEQRQRIGRQQRRHRADDHERDGGERHVAFHQARPKSPVGLSAKMRAIGANSVKYESSGNSALPKLSSSPTSRLPIMAPGRLPRPPTMTTTNAYGSTSKSAPGQTPRTAPPIPPPSAASPAPSANTSSDTTGTLMPTPWAISASSTAARMIAPVRVPSSASHSAAPMTIATATMKSRYAGKCR